MGYIYVIEDDDSIRELIKIALEGFGYNIRAYESAEPALEDMKKEKPELALFDIMLPGMDGLSAIRQIRKDLTLKDMPIICLTAKDKELDKVAGLDVGADDYITKPFGVLELAARIRSLLRRSGKEEEPEMSAGPIKINPMTREVFVEDQLIDLTFKEYELLLYLFENSSRVVSRDEMLNQIWGYEYDGESRTLDIHIRTLRGKLGQIGAECIKTIRSVGYRFVK
ncbi:MAG: response regulator transcription factor [Anaerolineaceae bacterium]|nr:MAG: response regulator transcription factor [Anaerolineaceae bacterium]